MNPGFEVTKARNGSTRPADCAVRTSLSSLIMLVLGIEGSANKVGVGIVREDGEILANPRRTCALATSPSPLRPVHARPPQCLPTVSA